MTKDRTTQSAEVFALPFGGNAAFLALPAFAAMSALPAFVPGV
jgi:hypothetical protein